MESLEIPSSVKCTLVKLGGLGGKDASVSLDGVETIVETVFQKAFISKNNDLKAALLIGSLKQDGTLRSVDPDALANYFGTLTEFVTIVCRQNASDVAVQNFLRDCNWEADRIDCFLKYYTATKHKIRAYLSLYKNEMSKLVDVDWRLDFRLKDGKAGLVKDIIYIIEFKLDHSGVEETIKFTATPAELEDLVSALRDACHTVRRVAT